MAKQGGADRPGDEGDGEGGQRLQGGRSGIALREKDMREDDDRGGRINVEVEKLNGSTNERGDNDFIARVDRGSVLRVFECGGCGLHRSFLFLRERKAI